MTLARHTPLRHAARPARSMSWLEQFKQEALAQGISRNAIAQASPYLVYDQRIVNIDRGQRVFSQSFVEFSSRMVPGGRISAGPGAAQETHRHVRARRKGIRRAGRGHHRVLGTGKRLRRHSGQGQSSIRSITTLAYDCRRADMFRDHLFSALKLLDRGDLAATEMVGSWAGELGQTQMMPTEYFKYAVDYDGDGHRNLLRSPADVIGSTANYIAALGWKRGEPWLQEVRVPQNLPWEETGLDVKHPRSQWAKWGVTLADGRPLPSDSMPTSVVLPMGRRGPAFSPTTISRSI